VRHATDEDLDRLSGLLTTLRGLDGLREKSRGTFYRRGRALLHFHADGDDLFADVRLEPSGDFERVRVTTRREQARLATDVRRAVGSDESRAGS
jgi:hypothetical protein